VRLSDLRRAYRLIHDCRDVGHDRRTWPVVLIEGLASLVDAQVVTLTEIGVGAPGVPPHQELIADRGWHSPGVRELFFQSYGVDQDYRRLPTFQRFAALQGVLITRTREQLVVDDDWYNSREFNEYNRSFMLDDVIMSHAKLGDPPTLQGFNLARGVGRERFGAGERRLIRLLHGELTRHVGISLARELGHPCPNCRPGSRRPSDACSKATARSRLRSGWG
jgi:hypothetical protein